MVCLFSPKKNKKQKQKQKQKQKNKNKNKKTKQKKKKKKKQNKKQKCCLFDSVTNYSATPMVTQHHIKILFFFSIFFKKKKIKGYHNNPYAKTNLQERG